MNGGTALDSFRCILADGIRDEFAVNFRDFAGIVFLKAYAGDDVTSAKPNRSILAESEKLLWRIFHEVITLDPDFFSERYFTGASLIVSWIVRNGDHFRVIV